MIACEKPMFVLECGRAIAMDEDVIVQVQVSSLNGLGQKGEGIACVKPKHELEDSGAPA